MKYNPNIHHRRSIRLKGYDYSQNGAYFVTICVQNRECLFGKIKNGAMILNDAGKIMKTEWEQLPQHFLNVELDVFVVMPNHFHGIIVIQNENNKNVGAIPCGCPVMNDGTTSRVPTRGTPTNIPTKKNTIGDIIGAFKSLTINEYIRGVKNGKFPPFEKRIWQRNYHEHIIRDENSLEKIQNYIIRNPQKWQDDKFFVN